MHAVGKKARYIYGGAALDPIKNLPIQAIARYDLETGEIQMWTKSVHFFMGEPQFIPRGTHTDPGLQPLLEQMHEASGGHLGSLTDSRHRPSRALNGHSAPCNGDTAELSSGTQQIPISEQEATSGSLSEMREDDGWVLSVGFDAELQRSEVVLLDAADIEAGPIATLPLASPAGYGIHGTWVPAYYGP